MVKENDEIFERRVIRAKDGRQIHVYKPFGQQSHKNTEYYAVVKVTQSLKLDQGAFHSTHEVEIRIPDCKNIWEAMDKYQEVVEKWQKKQQKPKKGIIQVADPAVLKNLRRNNGPSKA